MKTYLAGTNPDLDPDFGQMFDQKQKEGWPKLMRIVPLTICEHTHPSFGPDFVRLVKRF
jgi:hypothetical protein